MSRIYAAVRPSAAANDVSTHDDASRKESTRTPTVNVTVTIAVAVAGVSVSVGVGGRETVKRARGAAVFAGRDDRASRSHSRFRSRHPPPLLFLLLLPILLPLLPPLPLFPPLLLFRFSCAGPITSSAGATAAHVDVESSGLPTCRRRGLARERRRR